MPSMKSLLVQMAIGLGVIWASNNVSFIRNIVGPRS